MTRALDVSDALKVAVHSLALARSFTGHESDCDCTVCWRISEAQVSVVAAVVEADLLVDGAGS